MTVMSWRGLVERAALQRTTCPTLTPFPPPPPPQVCLLRRRPLGGPPGPRHLPGAGPAAAGGDRRRRRRDVRAPRAALPAGLPQPPDVVHPGLPGGLPACLQVNLCKVLVDSCLAPQSGKEGQGVVAAAQAQTQAPPVEVHKQVKFAMAGRQPAPPQTHSASHASRCSPGLGPVPWAVNAEIYPLPVRGLATGSMCTRVNASAAWVVSFHACLPVPACRNAWLLAILVAAAPLLAGIAATANWVSNAAVAQSFLTLTQRLGGSGAFGLYACIAAAGFGWCVGLWRVGRRRQLHATVVLMFRPPALLSCILPSYPALHRFSARFQPATPLPPTPPTNPSCSHPCLAPGPLWLCQS